MLVWFSGFSAHQAALLAVFNGEDEPSLLPALAFKES